MTKNKKDRRFLKSEDAILAALLKTIGNRKYVLTIKNSYIYKKAKISRATFGRHHRNLNEVMEQKDAEMMQDFIKIDFEGCDETEAWRKMMLFMRRNREIFVARFRQTDERFLRKMIKAMVKKVNFGWVRYDKELVGKIFEMLCAEVIGVMKLWTENGMDVRKIDRLAREIARLAETADKRWMGVVGKI